MLALLGKASGELVERGLAPPIIVGGAAVEYYTGAAIMTGDFDIVCAADESLKESLIRLGFREEDRHGRILKGLYHPDLLLAVEVVSGTFFDSRADRDRLSAIKLDGGGEVFIASVEDMIADRLGQYASSPRGVPEMLRQAVILLQLAEDIDEDYLDRRIKDETDDQYNLEFLREKADAYTPRPGGPEQIP